MRERRPKDPSARLAAGCHVLEAALTLPSAPVARRFRVGQGATAPAVDGAVWLDHVRYHRSRSTDARDRLIAANIDYARRVAKRYVRSPDLRDDLEQVAVEALLQAIDRFEPTRGIPFPGYARPLIEGALKRFYRDSGWGVRVPRRVHELSGPIRRATDLLQQDLGRDASDGEIADFLGVDLREVTATRMAEAARNGRSLDAELHERGGADPALARVEDRAAVQQAVGSLSATSREVVGLYFEDGLSQSAIAERLGVSQMQVSRLLTQALAQLRSRVPNA